MNEWEFTAQVASWINEHLAQELSLPFSRAACEQTRDGKRRDLTLLDKSGRVVLTGEVKLPYKPDGVSPFAAAVHGDARQKAKKAKTRFFFTWNVNRFVLWETDPTKTTWYEHEYRSWIVTDVRKDNDLETTPTSQAIRAFLFEKFLPEFTRILSGETVIGHKELDEKFVEMLEYALSRPINLTFDQLFERYHDPKQKRDIDQWMRVFLGFLISDDEEGIKENLERASQRANYMLLTRIVFYEALLRRYRQMGRLSILKHLDSGNELRLHLEGCFSRAKDVTRDYETVFGLDHKDFGNIVPFYNDLVVPLWRDVVENVNEFDFSELDHEIIGRIFERLISPEERRRYGQFYTRVEVVDLINSFCIRTGSEKVMDPACGGGTFLVRAYARKREIAPSRSHDEILNDLYGVDLDRFAAQLTTINLATRNLKSDENYPIIARDNFFNTESEKAFVTLPHHIVSKGLGKIQEREVKIPLLDAVIGNPPYVEQTSIPKSKNRAKPQRGTKDYYQQLVEKEWRTKLSGRSDLHCYFWLHAASFLKDDGWLCLLTSSQWLDVDYGFRLQEWMLDNFEIVAILESLAEPWFEGARVGTCITILRQQKDKKKRMQNLIRFIQLRKPLAEILSYDGSTAGMVSITDSFRDEILSIKVTSVCDRYRARLIKQSDLWNDGIDLARVMKDGKGYYGGKWGVHLRAPDIWFKILERTGKNWRPLGKVGDVYYGIKSGADDFFYVRDVTSKFKTTGEEIIFANGKNYYISKLDFDKVKIVSCGEGELGVIDAEYLEPEIHSMMEIEKYSVTQKDCSRMILLVSSRRKNLKGKKALEYIEWGEARGYHLNETCQSRITEEREWYDLTGHLRAPLLWAKQHQYRHSAPVNADGLAANCGIYEIHPPDSLKDPLIWAGILNSTWVLLSAIQYGRPVGNEGSWSTMVAEVKMMPVPNPIGKSSSLHTRIAGIFAKMKDRPAIQFLSERRLRDMAYRQKGWEKKLKDLSDITELDRPDRRELDDAVLEMLGVSRPKERAALIDELYQGLREHFEQIRQKEEKAILNKAKEKRRSLTRPADIAAQIIEDIKKNSPDLLRSFDPFFIRLGTPFDTIEIPTNGDAGLSTDMFNDHTISFSKGRKALSVIQARNRSQGELIVILAKYGESGIVRVPVNDEECIRLVREYEDFARKRLSRIKELIEERTADEEMQEKIFQALIPRIRELSHRMRFKSTGESGLPPSRE